MRNYTVLAVVLGVVLILNAICECGGWWGRSSRNSTRSGSRSSQSRTVSRKSGYSGKPGSGKVHFGKTGIRDRDKTGHKTGLGTLARKAVSHPINTYKAVKAFAKNYQEMRRKNIKGGNLEAHRKANKEATEVSDPETAAALSAVREQYKNFRVKQNPDGSTHIGDTRTPGERKATMRANEQGRKDGSGND